MDLSAIFYQADRNLRVGRLPPIGYSSLTDLENHCPRAISRHSISQWEL